MEDGLRAVPRGVPQPTAMLPRGEVGAEVFVYLGDSRPSRQPNERADALEECLNSVPAEDLQSSRRLQLKLSLITHYLIIGFCLVALGFCISQGVPQRCLDCNVWQTSWPLVWIGNRLLLAVTFVVMAHLQNCSRARTPKALVILRGFLRQVLNPTWYVFGVYPLFYMRPSCKEAVAIGRILWWMQTTLFLLALLCYLSICLCLPCLILLLYRLRPRSPNEIPTPESVMSKLRKEKYSELLESFKRDYNVDEIELASTSDRLNEVMEHNPIIKAIASGITGDDHTLGRPGLPLPTTLKVEKSCPICMMDFLPDDLTTTMPCDRRHFFHQDCIVRWLQASQFCPICRANIVELVNGSPNSSTWLSQPPA